MKNFLTSGGFVLQKLSSFWCHLKKFLIEQKDDTLYTCWLKDIDLLNTSTIENFYHLELQAPSELHRIWFQKNILEEACHHFKKLYQNQHLKIQIKVRQKTSQNQPSTPKVLSLPDSNLLTHHSPYSRSSGFNPFKPHLFNPLYTFKNFISGQNTDLAYKSSLGVVKSKEALDIMNPLFIYGPSGLGKTHLLNAIGQESLKRFPQKKVIYISGERFLNEYINALQNRKMNAFRNKFRKNCNLLLIDDIHILARGPGIQEEFFHTFNELYNRKIQVVACSDQSPHYINSLQERIKTRLTGGLVADISYPDFETRSAILKNKLELKNILISKESLKLISKNCQRSIREMEGVLNRIKMMIEMSEKAELTFSELEKILQGYKKEISVVDIKKKTALIFKVTLEEMVSASRKKHIVIARQTAMYLIRKILNKSLNDICKLFKKRDHTTVLNSIRKIERSLVKDKEFQTLFQLLKHELEKEFQIIV